MAQSNSLLSQFFQEAVDLLTDAEEILLELEQYGEDQEKVRSLFRLFHTLKGNANMVGEEAISTVTHSLETELDRVRSGKAEMDPDLLQYSFEVIDVLNAIAREENSKDYLEQLEELTDRLHSSGEAGNARQAASPQEAGNARAAATDSIENANPADSTRQVDQRQGDQQGRDIPLMSFVGAQIPSSGGVKEPSFSLWKNLLRHFYRFRDLYDKIQREDGDQYELLMDLGMVSIELRSEAGELSEVIHKETVYLEKLVATFAREEILYNEISYEILDVLLGDINRGIWEELFLNGALVYKKIVTMEDLNQFGEKLKDDRKLWILDLAFKSSNLRRSNDFFAGIAKLNRSLKVPFIFISSKTEYYRKATALLDDALEGFPRVAGDIEEGVKFYLAREDRDGKKGSDS